MSLRNLLGKSALWCLAGMSGVMGLATAGPPGALISPGRFSKAGAGGAAPAPCRPLTRPRRDRTQQIVLAAFVQKPADNDAADPPASMPAARSAERDDPDAAIVPPDFDASLPVAQVTPIDLASVLQLAGAQNLNLILAQQRVLEATAARQLAAAQLLPNLNGGTNYDAHVGAVQQASGNILKVNRDALYLGAGGNAVAAGSVGVPGIQYNLNLSETIYGTLVTRQLVERNEYASAAARNQVLSRAVTAYGELLRAEALRSNALETLANAREVARVTSAFAQAGQGRDSDANRAKTEVALRGANVLETDADVLAASARLCEILNLDSALRLHPADNWIVPRPVVPELIPLPELLAIALYQRPEVSEQRAAVHAALLRFSAAKMLPFSPQIIAGYSAGTFGGGSDLSASSTQPRFSAPEDQPRFGNFGGRSDFDVAAYWSLRNLGIGNKALIDAARSRCQIADLERFAVLNRVQAEVTQAYSRMHARYAEIELREQAVRSSRAGFEEDLSRTRGNIGLPIEVLNSLRLMSRARADYGNAIIDYNEAQFRLYVAIGQPDPDLLARPVADSNGNSQE